FFERLAHGFKHAAFELGQFVEKQNSMVCQRDFAGCRIDVAAEQAGITRGVMRGAKWPACDERLASFKQSDYAVNLGGLQSLIESEWRQNRRQALRQHGFACAWGTNKKYIMSAGGGDLQRALHTFLSFDLSEIDILVVVVIEDAGHFHFGWRDLDFAFKE